jgi:enoyl-CoA hydratase/carnithine racemase
MPHGIETATKTGVTTITLNRPDKLNAYNAEMGEALEAAFLEADADDSVRAVIVTGAGRAFCAGADISGGAESFEGEGNFGARGRARIEGGFVMAIYRCRKPVIAAINGAAVGVGATITLPMDIRLCAEEAKFGFVFTRRGLVPEAGAAWFLPRLVGLPQALRWCYSGAVFPAAEALKGGLVSEVCPQAELLPRAEAIAREIVENTAPLATALTKRMLWELSAHNTPMDVLKIDAPLNMALGASPDVREGVAAFLEKRKPNFPLSPNTDVPTIAQTLAAKAAG